MTGVRQCQPTSGHTPTPWKLHDQWLFSETGPLAIAGGYQDWVTAPGGSKYEEWMANAAFIVEAVNSHELLKQKLEFAEFEWNRATDGMKERDTRIKELEGALRSFVSCYNSTHGSWQSHELQRTRKEAIAALQPKAGS